MFSQRDIPRTLHKLLSFILCLTLSPYILPGAAQTLGSGLDGAAPVQARWSEVYQLKVLVDALPQLQRELGDLEVVTTKGVTAENFDVRLRARDGKLILERPDELRPGQSQIFVEDDLHQPAPGNLQTPGKLSDALRNELLREWQWLFLKKLPRDPASSLQVELRFVAMQQRATGNESDGTPPAKVEWIDEPREEIQDNAAAAYVDDRFRLEARNLSKRDLHATLAILSADRSVSLGGSMDNGMVTDTLLPADGQWHPVSRRIRADWPLGQDTFRILAFPKRSQLDGLLQSLGARGLLALADRTPGSLAYATASVDVTVRARPGQENKTPTGAAGVAPRRLEMNGLAWEGMVSKRGFDDGG